VSIPSEVFFAYNLAMSCSTSQANAAEPSSALQPNSQGAADVRADFAALISGCGVVEAESRVKFEVTGKDRVRWLNGMVSNNVRDLAPGRGVYAFVLNPQGHIQGDLYAYQRGDSLLLDIAHAQLEKVLPLLKRYIIMDDVKITEASGQIASIGLIGPQSRDVLRRVGIEVPELEPLQFAEVKSTALTVLRGDNPAVDCFELWLSPENLSVLRTSLLQAGVRPASAASLNLLRIACGIPEYGQDIRDRDLPQETGQERALNYTKGCYIGQEIVERIRARGAVHRQFSSFYVDGSLPSRGTKIQREGKDVGEITSAASLPLASGDLAVALGYIRREALTGSNPVEAGGCRLRIAQLPLTEVFSR
jgi:folate-binding protein YgfZ